MRKGVMICLIFFVALTLVFGFLFLKELLAQRQEESGFAELSQLITPEHGKNVSKGDGSPSPNPESETAARRDLTPLFARNSDCIGWICIAGTKVNYPVMHTPEEPERYLRRNFDRASSTAGVPFLDGACSLENDNLIIYGHNMKSGTMFADITKYKDSGYASAHPVIELETDDGCKEFTVFAVVRMKMDDSWYGFRNAKNQEQYDRTVAQIKERSLYDTGITPSFGDQLLTLSTCYGANKDDRIIVIGAEIS